MRTWLNKDNQWVSERPDIAWTGLVDINTGEKIFEDDKISVLKNPWSSNSSTRGNIDLSKNDEFNPLACPEFFQEYYKPILIQKGDTK